MFQCQRFAKSYIINALIAVLCMAWLSVAFAKSPPAVAELVANAKASVHVIDMKAFHDLLAKPDHGLIIDVREASEYDNGHIAGAINIPRGLVEFHIWPLIGYPKTRPADVKLTIYCQSGWRAALASSSLKKLGFSKVTTVDMNLKDWVDAGYPLTEPEFK